jgi:hypothetical protein
MGRRQMAGNSPAVWGEDRSFVDPCESRVPACQTGPATGKKRIRPLDPLI